MEERVHTNGNSNGSNGEGSVRTVGSQPGTSQQASPMTMKNAKTWCTEHGMSMAECFYEHHKPVDMRRLRLPCGHLCMQPKGYKIEACECGRTWVLQMDNGGAWEAREQ